MDVGDVINGWRIVEDAGAGRSGRVFIVCREGDPDGLFALKMQRTDSPDVASVTVLCRSATLADGLSTALFVLGPEEGRAFLAARLDSLVCGDVAALWLLRDGSAAAFDRDGRFRR